MIELEIELRSMTESDCQGICTLKADHGEAIEPQLQQQLLDKILDHKDHRAFVAVIGGDIIAYAHGFISHRLSGGAYLEVSSLLVHRLFRAKGIGKMLVDELIGSANEVSVIRARCQVDREAAHLFYAELGFEVIKTQSVFQRSDS